MPKFVLTPIPFRSRDAPTPLPPPPPPPTPSTLYCKLQAEIACIGAQNAALYSKCALRLDELQRGGMPEFIGKPTRSAPSLVRAASAPDLLSERAGTQAARSW